MSESDGKKRGWFQAPQYSADGVSPNRGVFLGCLTTIAVIILLVIAQRSLRNSISPNSLPAVALQGVGITIFEPDYVTRKYGLELHYGLMSYSSVSEIVQQFRARGIAFDPADIASSNLPPNGNKPPFVVQELRCPAYPAGGGKTVSLELMFFNDRLMQTRTSGGVKSDKRLSNEFNGYLSRYS